MQTELGFVLSTSIQNIQSNLKDVQRKSGDIVAIKEIVEILDISIANLLLENNKYFDIASKPGYFQLVMDLLISLVENYGEYLYSSHSQVWKTIRSDWQLLKEHIVRLQRRSDLVMTNDAQVFIGAIQWMAENGLEEDLAIIDFARQRKNTTLRDNDIHGLLEYCRQRILEKTNKAQNQMDKDQIEIRELFHELRSGEASRPLTILIHGWGGLSANKFLATIRKLTQQDQHDSICMVKTSDSSDLHGLPENSDLILLDLTLAEDYFFYHNANRDLVYFPASVQKDKDLLPDWKERVRVVILESDGFYTPEMVQTAKQHGILVYVWDGADTVRPRT